MAQRGASYQRILEKYFPRTSVKPRSGNVSLAQPFKAGGEGNKDRLVALATTQFAFRQPSLTRRGEWYADLIPALNGGATVRRRYAALSFSRIRLLTISSEHFRITS